MSTNPNGILYYGVRLDEEPDDYHKINSKWQETNAPQKPTHQDYETPEWDKWRETKDVWLETTQNIEIAWSGSDYGQAFYVHCVPLEKRVEWDDQIDLGRDVPLSIQPEADEYIKRFCERFGLQFKRPSWHLACLYF